MSSAESPEVQAEEATPEILDTEPKAEAPYFYLRHVGRRAENRAVRRARAGHRRQGAVLDNGVRIRRKGRYRLTKVRYKEFVKNHERLFFYIDNGIVEAIDPSTMKAIPRDELLNLIHGIAGDFGQKITVGDVALPPRLMAPGEQPPPSRPEDVTRPDMGESAIMAAVDQHDAEMMGEANPPPAEEPPVEEEVETEEETEELDGGEEYELTEADLKKMSRKELDKLAKENDLDPKQYSNKDELIEALLGE